MNANELADELITFVEVYKINNLDCMTLSDAINMLRQLQAEIEALKYEKSSGVYDDSKLHLSLQKDKETGELLAVTYTDDEHRIIEVLWEKPPAKTLTDEEIADIISSGEYWTLDEHLNIVSVHFDKFARAILRKAQEK
jgi:hypothetical protein